MSPLDVMFWAVAGVVVVGCVALTVVIVAGVVHGLARKKPRSRSTEVMRGSGDS